MNDYERGRADMKAEILAVIKKDMKEYRNESRMTDIQRLQVLYSISASALSAEWGKILDME